VNVEDYDALLAPHDEDDEAGVGDELLDGEYEMVLPEEVVAIVTTRSGRKVVPRVWAD
jgi:hypothetical protein